MARRTSSDRPGAVGSAGCRLLSQRRGVVTGEFAFADLSNHPDAEAANFDFGCGIELLKTKVELSIGELKGVKAIASAQTRLDAELKLEHLQFADHQSLDASVAEFELNGSLAAQAEILSSVQQANNLSSLSPTQ